MVAGIIHSDRRVQLVPNSVHRQHGVSSIDSGTRCARAYVDCYGAISGHNDPRHYRPFGATHGGRRTNFTLIVVSRGLQCPICELYTREDRPITVIMS